MFDFSTVSFPAICLKFPNESSQLEIPQFHLIPCDRHILYLLHLLSRPPTISLCYPPFFQLSRCVSLTSLFLSLSVSVWSLCCLPCLCPHLAPESMILLGSIERSQLQSLLSQQLGRARRLDFLRERAQDNGTHVPTFPQDSPKTGRGVRFLV